MKELNTSSFTKRRKLLLLLVLIAAAVVLARGISARYVLQEKKAGVAVAKEFYFTSDLLGEGTDNTYTIDAGTESFDIKLFNYEDKLRVTADTIKYKVEVTGGTVDNTAKASITDELQTLAGGGGNEAVITVKPDRTVPVVVTATSTSPYKKVLTATFNLASGNQYTVEDKEGNTAAVLTITCTDIKDSVVGKAFTIELPAGVIPDATDSRVTKIADDNTYTFTVGENGMYSLVLLKKDKKLNLNQDAKALEGEIISVPTPSNTP